MKVPITISGLKQVRQSLSGYGKTISERIRDTTNLAAINIDREAKKAAPVDTGRLRASIHPVYAGRTDERFPYADKEGKQFDGGTGERSGDIEAKVVTNVDYAPKMEARKPYLHPAAENERPHLIRRIKDILGQK